ncbi:mycothiol system anti-sigma-R factor [Propionibacterium cyclohexanicum]|uniref:Mycothiol system anti-sigma-R factor n=1 Tax=Propionibacterium cyclohexanicum TaxID=64702 RepID=A0A1H9QZ59_9ACTN|nr:zf-HC2 domain-containing protein [Propionibacterium cyclohexanicum]SER65746.1 mycothiol system anti-sigma-R factor [Propionibacterium cyclohexanicum]
MTELRDGQEPAEVREDSCEFALSSVQAFLHGELPEATADEIRAHLLMCEKCMDNFDVEQMISAMVKRCWCTPAASDALRLRIAAVAHLGDTI